MDQANITLAALTGDISFAQRTITLNPDRLTIPIGRASKSLSKGILGASDNAWFDSPVMSREHAEVCLNSIAKTITICDLGSMHGTYLNNGRLSPNQPTQLGDGDVITFGAEVRRGPEVFPACSFRANIEWSPYQTVRTFSVPTSSDIEEDEGYGFSDPIMEEHGWISSEDDVSLEIPQPTKACHAFTAIDLTRDDSPIPASSAKMDLTGDTPVELLDEDHIIQPRPARPVLDCNADPIFENVHSHNPSNLIDATISYGLPSSDSDDESYEMPDSSSENTDCSDDSDILVASDASDASSEPEGREYPVLDEESAEDNFETQDENQEFMAQDSISIGRFQHNALHEPENITDADDNSDFSLSKAGAEGLRVLFEDVSQRSTESAPGAKVPAEVDNQIENRLYSAQEVKGFSILGEPVEVTPEQPSNIAPVCSVSEQVNDIWGMKEVMVGNIPNERSVGARQPSPSDAAMVKAASQQPPEQATNDTPEYHFQTQEFTQPSLALGEKTGKHAFFEAREKNKARFLSLGDMEGTGGMESSALSQPSLALNTSSSKEEPQTVRLSAAPMSYRKGDGTLYYSQSTHHTDIQSSLLTLQLPPLRDRPASPEYDMTSAVKYNESKAKSARPNLSIHDIIENSSRDQPTRGSSPKTGDKRKACGISEILTDEVRAWASSKDTSKSSDKNSNRSSRITPPLADLAATPISDEQPAKRLKTFLERAAFAAAGGVAVGAGLFLGLVATAPNFS